jgi:hypothetical protein
MWPRKGVKPLKTKTLRGRCPLKLPQQGNDSPAPRNFRGREYRVVKIQMMEIDPLAALPTTLDFHLCED